MDDALRRDIELVAPNQNARHGTSPLDCRTAWLLSNRDRLAETKKVSGNLFRYYGCDFLVSLDKEHNPTSVVICVALVASLDEWKLPRL
jgi:hypothetical protein